MFHSSFYDYINSWYISDFEKISMAIAIVFLKRMQYFQLNIASFSSTGFRREREREKNDVERKHIHRLIRSMVALTGQCFIQRI